MGHLVVDDGTLGRCCAWTGDTGRYERWLHHGGMRPRRHSTVEVGESRRREGRQEVGSGGMLMVKTPEEVPAQAVPAGDADPRWFAERQVWTAPMLEALRRGGPDGGR